VVAARRHRPRAALVDAPETRDGVSMPASRLPTAIRAWQMVAPAVERDAAQPSRRFRLEPRLLPVPELGPGEALVEIAGCGVCGTDLGYFYDSVPTVSKPPLTLGHEISGTVVAGEDCWIGKEVIVPTIIPCRSCDLCRSGRANRCLAQKMPGNSYGPYGGFASHIPVPARELCPIPEKAAIPLEELAVVADAVATPYQAALRGRLQRGDRVIIIGVTGGLGIYMAQWAKLFEAEVVVGIGRSPEKLAASLEYGVDLALSAAGRSPWEIRKEFWSLCRRNRLDARSGWKIFEMSGTRAGQEAALELLGYAGVLVVVGFSPEPVSHHLSRLMAFDADIRGTWGCPPEHYPYIVEQVLREKIRIRSLVTTRPLDRIPEAFEELHARSCGMQRVVLTPAFG
jgi:6-hydroxycyclohex-1-ene-1-carbonyl-CoA dehydrogenase